MTPDPSPAGPITEPIFIVCEGSGCPTHVPTAAASISPPGICQMCGQTVETNLTIAVLHKRKDILAMLKRGDFDA